MRRILAALPLLALAGCYETREVPNPHAAESPTEVTLVAVAPDGTRLWNAGGVFFAGSGAQWSESCGKGQTCTHRTPTAGGGQ